MSEKSELDLNSDVVSSEPESRLSAKNDVVLGGSSVEEETIKVRVLETDEKGREGLRIEARERDNGVELKDKADKMEDVSLNEGTVSESLMDLDGCVNAAPLLSVGADMGSDKGAELEGDEKGKEVSVEAEKEKVDSAEIGRKAEEGLDKGISVLSNSELKLDEYLEPNSVESGESERVCVNVAPLSSVGADMGSDKGADLEGDEIGKEVSVEAEKEKVDSTEIGRKTEEGLDKGVSVSSDSEAKLDENLEPDSVESGESERSLSEDIPVIDEEKEVDVHESLNQVSDSEVVPSEGLRNGDLEVHLEAGPKRNGNKSDSIDIVIELNPKKGSLKGASRCGKVKSSGLKPSFNIGDLIWGKVRSHPWWPGQICDPSAASRKAKKYFKRDAYLIAYYGDNTFAWNEASHVKPFFENYTQMEKQSNTEDFHYAMDCVLEEVARRVEFSLACHCLSEEVYEQIQSQIIVNAGIEEELSRREGGDSSLTVASFQPAKLVQCIKELAQDPIDGANDKLEFTMARSELLAFSRWKGYDQLPEFNMVGVILEKDSDMVLPSKNKHSDEVTQAKDEKSKDNDSVTEKAKNKIQKCSTLKRKLDSKDGSSPSKKEKSITDLMVEKSPKTPIGRNSSGSKATSKKRKAELNNLPVKQLKSKAKEVENKPVLAKPSFKIGESIRRAASQLNGSSPILKNVNKEPKSLQSQTKSKEEKTSEEPKSGKKKKTDYSPASKEPTKANSSSDVTSSQPASEDDNQSLEDMFGGKSGKKLTKNARKSNKLGTAELPHQLGSTTEAFWSKRIGKSISEDQDEIPLETSTKGEKGEDSFSEPNAKQNDSDQDVETEADKSADQAENGSDSTDDMSPTALILNFSDLDSVPSETSLNKIFSQYGSINKSQTEIFKKTNRARVVFRKRSDAETAFSSAGKYSTFGPSLVSYRLKYLSSSEIKASPKKRSKTDKSEEEDNKQ